MKSKFFAVALLFWSTTLFAQQKTPVLFIADKLCLIYIDGTQLGSVEANKPLLLNLTLGEHYFQAKRDNETFSQIIKCDDDKQKVVEIKFGAVQGVAAPNTTTSTSTRTPVTIIDNDVKLPGLMQQSEAAPVQYYYAFDKSDTLAIKSGQSGEAGTNNVFVYSYPQNQQIFFKERVNGSEEKFIIPQKGVYRIVVSTNYFSTKNSKLRLVRLPSPTSTTTFNHIPVSKNDTTFIQLNDIYERIETGGFYKGIQLPKNTTFWVYWIGIGEESKVKYDTFKEVFSRINKGKNANPLYAYGAGNTNELPTYNNSAKVMDYFFTDNNNAQLFVKGLVSNTYTFKSGKSITSDFGIVNTVPKELNLIVKAGAMRGQFVNMKIGAFTVSSTYALAE